MIVSAMLQLVSLKEEGPGFCDDWLDWELIVGLKIGN